MLLVLTIALAIAGVHAEMAVEHLAPSVVKANPPQWVTAVAIVAKTNAIVALAIAKALVMAAVFLVLRDKLSFWLGSANALHFPTFQTLITMAKRLTWICLFLLCIAGVKAQTYCYHCYKSYENDARQSEDFYHYITFQGNCLYTSEFATPTVNINGMDVSQMYRYQGGKDKDGNMYYGYALPQYDPLSNDIFASNMMYSMSGYLVSPDKRTINFITTNYNNGTIVFCYELCPDKNCKKDTGSNHSIPSMRH